MSESGPSTEADPRAARVVVGIDGSRGSRQALEHALAVFGPATRYVLVNVLSPGAFAPERRAQGRVLSSAVARLDASGITAEPIAREGSPAAVLAEAAADLGADALVVGSRGAYVYVAGRTGGSALGSVCRELLERAPCDVLVVREKVG